jgi:hypothetical protein
MAEQSPAIAGQPLVYETRLPLEWLPDAPADAGRLADLRQRNLRLLRQLDLLEQQTAEPGEGHGAGQELARIEAKLDLLLDLVGGLLARQTGAPAAVTVRISADGLQWPASGQVPAVGALGEVRLALRPELPHPLCLPVRIVAAGAWVEAEFLELGEALVEMLEKTVFRYHRRQVAQARLIQAPDTGR